MPKKFDFKSIFIAIILIGFTSTATIAAIGEGLNLLSGDLTPEEQSEVDNKKSSLNEYIYVYSGETKLISFPRKVESINFSQDSGFSIRTLIGGIWKDMSNNPDDYEVMQGYIVRNFGNQRVDIHVEYAPLISADQTLYQKELKAGWNLYAPAVKNDYCSAVKAGDALQGSNYSQIIDFSTLGFKKSFSNEVAINHVYSGETLFFNKEKGHPQDFREDGNYSIKNNVDAEENFIYEGSAYGVFVNNDTLVSGNQNITDGIGNELIKYNNHPVIIYDSDMESELTVTNINEIELLNFNITSKYNGVDEKGTSSILSTLAVVGYNKTITETFDNLKLEIDGVNAGYTLGECGMNGVDEPCYGGTLYIHLNEPKLLSRGVKSNIRLFATPKSGLDLDYYVQLDIQNTLILDDQNLLPYCGYKGYILGSNNINRKVITIDTVSSEGNGGGGNDINPAELAAAEFLAAKGIINAQSEASNYQLGSTITRAEVSKIIANIAEISANSGCNNSFTDITSTIPNSWVCGYAEALLNAGIIENNDLFRPTDNLTKVEAVKFVLDSVGEVVTTTEETWKQDYVNYAVENGFVSIFEDYDNEADRGLLFSIAAAAITEEEGGDDILSELDDLLGGSGSTNTGSTNTGSLLEAPTNIQLINSSTGSLEISWDAVTDAVSYNAYITEKGEDDISSNLELLLSSGSLSNVNTFTFEGLESGTTYIIMVKANDIDGNIGELSEIVEFTTNSVVIEDLDVEKSVIQPNLTNILTNIDRTGLLAFDLTAGEVDVTLTNIELAYSGTTDGSDFSNISVYNLDTKITNGESSTFSNNEVLLTFNNTVVKAGETSTFVVNANVGTGTIGNIHSISIGEINASNNVNLNGVSTDSFIVSEGEEESIGSIQVSFNSTSDINSQTKVNLAGMQMTVLELDYQVSNEEVNVGNIVFNTIDDLRNVISSAKITVLGGESYSNTIITDTTITFTNIVLATDNSNIILEITTNNIGNGEIGESINETSFRGVDFTDIQGINSNSEIQDISLNFYSADIDVQPALMNLSVNDTFDLDDNSASINLSIDTGDNTFTDNTITITDIYLESDVSGSGLTIENNDGNIIVSGETQSSIIINSDNIVQDGDLFRFNVLGNNDEVRILPHGIIFELDGESYTSSNTDIIDLGTYITE